MHQGLFTVDVFGLFDPGRLEVLWRDEPRPPEPALDAMVADTWRRCLLEANQAGTLLFNGQLARYLRHRVDGGRLVIEVGPTDYANFLGTNFHNHARAAEFGWDLYGNPLGTSAILTTSDGWLLLGLRNRRVACYPGCIHTFGGALEACDRTPTGTVDVFESVRRELKEELRLQADEEITSRCLGIVRENRINQPEMVFDVRVRPSRSDLEARFDRNAHGQEHETLVAVRDDPAALGPFVRSAGLIAPVAVGALGLHGRVRFGEAWYADHARTLGLGPPDPMR